MDVGFNDLVMAGVQLGLYVWLMAWGLTWAFRTLSRWLGW